MPVALGGYGAATLLTLAAWFVCFGMTIVWRHTIGRGIEWVCDELDKATISLPWPVGTVHVFGPVISAGRWVNNSIATWLGEAALACEHATIFLWNHLVSIVEETAKWIEEGTLAELHAWESLFTVTLPRYFHDITRHIETLLHTATADAHKAEVAAERFASHEIARVETRAEEIVHHAEAVITADVLPRIRTVEHDIEGLKARLERIAKSLSYSSIVALIGATIWKELFNGVKCSSWGNLTRNLGCFAWKALEDIIGIMVSIVALEAVCDYLPYVEDAFGAIAGPMVHILNEVPLGKCEVPPKTWATFAVKRGPLPPPQTLGALPV